MNYEVITLAEKTIVGITARTKNSDPNMMVKIGELWHKLHAENIYATIANKANQCTIGLYSEYEGDVSSEYSITVGCEVTSLDQLSHDVVVKTIPQGKYAKFTITGHIQTAVCDFWDKLWKMDLDRSYLADFEEYWTADVENAKITIYISLKKKQMCFQKIDMVLWKRQEHFQHYFSAVPCTYSMTINVDISTIRALKLKLYPTMLYLIAAVVNRHEEFRMALDENGQVGIFSHMHPCHTIFHKETESFSNIWTEFDEDYRTFCDRYETDLQLYGKIEMLEAKPNTPENIFPISMIPWTIFTGFTLNLQNGYGYLLPIFTMGKFFSNDTKVLLPLSIQVHHAVCDGFHLSRFVEELQAWINKFSL